jgi:CRISPR type III-A-associated protein Csm2
MGQLKDALQRHGFKNQATREEQGGRGGFIKFRDNGKLRSALLTTEAKKWGEDFFNAKLTPTQLRKFYNEVKALEARIETTSFEENQALIGMLRSKVAYACPEKGQKKVPEIFKKFIEQCVKSIHSKQDFDDFVLFFEAVYGFFVGKGGRQ